MNAAQLQLRDEASPSGRLPLFLLLTYAVVRLLTAIKPFNRQDWLLENLLVFIAVPPLVLSFRRCRFSNVSYVLITLFLTLHAVGAHYTCSEMPLFNWLRDDWQLSHNHYDRLVHFLFGLFLGYPLCELLVRVVRLRPGWARVGTVHVVMAWSALYEMVKAAVAHLMSPELGAAYNGIQGDTWDAQKDAAIALAGAILAMTLAASWPGRTLTAEANHSGAAGNPPTLAATNGTRTTDLFIAAGVFVGCLSLVSFLWREPLALFLSLGISSALMLRR